TFTQWGMWAVQNAGLHWVDVHVADFNGDGKADLAGRISENGQWWVSISSGNHFTNQLWATWAPDTATFHWTNVVVGAFTGGGQVDVAGRESGRGKWWVAVSSGATFLTALWGAWGADLTGSLDWTNVVVGDFSGDGKVDIAGRIKETGQWWVNVSN